MNDLSGSEIKAILLSESHHYFEEIARMATRNWTLEMRKGNLFGGDRIILLRDETRTVRARYSCNVWLQDNRPEIIALLQLFEPSPVKPRAAPAPEYEI